MSRQEVWCTPTDSLSIVRWGADQQAGFEPTDYFGGTGILDIHSPDGERLGDVRIAQAGDLAPFELHSVTRFLAGIAVWREGEPALVEPVVLRGCNWTVFKQADVGGVHSVSHYRQSVRITSHGH